MNPDHPAKIIILNLLTLSFLIALLVTPYYLRFDPGILDHPLHSMELSLKAKILLINYTVFFLFILFFPLSFLLLVLFNKSRKLKSSSLRLSQFQKKNTYKLITIICLSLIAVSASLTAFGYFWENRQPEANYKPVHSKTKHDINVILIVIDALRADHLGCYGYKRNTSPQLDALAREGVLFKNCYSQSSWTKPSVSSILTSLYPSMHGTTLHTHALPEDLVTLAEILGDQGYINYGYVANPNLKKIFNFDQGFKFFDDRLMRDKLYNAVLRQMRQKPPYFLKIVNRKFDHNDYDNAELANARIIPWLDVYKKQNFFMYIHYMDPHAPLSPPPPYNTIFGYVEGDDDSRAISLYDGEIRFVDEQISKIIERLKSEKIFSKTMLIITSDHGRAFGEHNYYGHGATIYQEQLKVPLIIKFPGNFPAGRVVEGQVRSIDIMPTILDVLNIAVDLPLEGISLSSLITTETREGICEDVYIEENLANTYILNGVIKNNEWKYILTEKSKLRDIEQEGREELYNLLKDPAELKNLADLEPDVLGTIRDLLRSFKERGQKNMPMTSQVELDRETTRQLRSLGYLQ